MPVSPSIGAGVRAGEAEGARYQAHHPIIGQVGGDDSAPTSGEDGTVLRFVRQAAVPRVAAGQVSGGMYQEVVHV